MTNYIRGKYANAACAMLEWLHDMEILGGPVSQPSNRDPTITIYNMTAGGKKKLPKTFMGFAVKGITKSYDYRHSQLHDRVPVEEIQS